jgi:hypothetical protein
MGAFGNVRLACARLEGWDGPDLGGPCFETHRSAVELVERSAPVALRCSSA